MVFELLSYTNCYSLLCTRQLYSPWTGEQYYVNGFFTIPFTKFFSYNYHREIQIIYYSNSAMPEDGFSLYYTMNSESKQSIITVVRYRSTTVVMATHGLH